MHSKCAVPEFYAVKTQHGEGCGIKSISTSLSRICPKLLIHDGLAAVLSLRMDMSLQATDMRKIKGRGDAII